MNTDFITPLEVNGLTGRQLHMPGPPESREVLFVYGHHSSLERWYGIAELVSKHAHVTMPDLPGFGGMDSLYKIGQEATIDNLADWLADYVQQHYRGERYIIVGMSLGFVIATRMLQRHPELTSHVSKLVSLFGFAHKDDFVLHKRDRYFYLWGSRFFALPVTSDVYRHTLLNSFVLSHTYHRTANARQKFKDLSPDDHAKNMSFEIGLWQNEDLRTYMKTSSEFLTLDNTRQPIKLPVYHVAVKNDRYFNNKNVQAHYRQIFTDYYLVAELTSGSHAPTQVATAKDAKALIPPQLLELVQ